MPKSAAPFVALVAIIAVALASFAWPSGRLEPRDVPVGVVGAPPAALTQSGGFEVHRFASDAEARAAIRDRDVYGAFSGRTVYVATAASPSVAAGLRQAAAGARVVDVIPGTASDPRVATLGALTLPLMLIGVITAVLATLTATTLRRRLALVGAGAVFAGVLGALFTQTWLDALPGSWGLIAATVALGILAVASTVAGLAGHLGRAGLGLGAFLMMFVSNPWSGITSAPELLPEPAGAIGQLLPAGAAGGLLRGVAYFDGAGSGDHLIVIAAWAVAGLALMVTAALRRPAAAAAPAADRPAPGLSPSRGTAAP